MRDLLNRLDEAATGLEPVYDAVEQARKIYEDAQAAAEEVLTRWFERDLKELALRYPSRKFEASSGMGSFSVDISDRNGKDTYLWIWNSQQHGIADWSSIWKRWEDLLNDFSMRTGIEYVNLTRDVIVRGAQYRGK